MFDQIYTALGGGQAPSLDLGTAQTATLVNPFPAPMLKALCDGTLVLDPTAPPGGSLVTSTDGGKSSFDCAPGVGFPITVYFSLGGTTSGKLDSVYTVYLPTDDNAPGNLNPVLGDILVTAEFVAGPDGGVASPDGDSSSPDAGLPSADADLQDANTPTEDAGPVAEDAAPLAEDAQSPTDTSLASGSNGVLLDDAGTVVVRRQQRVGLEVLINRSSSEPLAAAQIASNPNKKTTERLDLSWFAEGGDFGSDGLGGHRTYFPGFPETPDLPFINAINNTWTLPKKDDYQSNTSRLIVVVRDIRGGVAWTSGTASLEPTP
jgi:hypothetical protein